MEQVLGSRTILHGGPRQWGRPASHLVADRGYDSAWFRTELEARGIKPCIPSSRSRKNPYAYDTTLYRQRQKVENLFAKLKDWRRIATPRPVRQYLLGHLHRCRHHLLSLTNES
ncbi:MAG: transposase [Pseudomonadota bacterium]|nr:transposase [Pseudomonadota bacterium]